MGKNTAFFAGPSDDASLIAAIIHFGFHVVPPVTTVNRPYPPKNPAANPFCYLSLVEESKLHPYGSPNVKISHAIDPLLTLMRSYEKDGALIAGQLIWTDDNKDRASKTKSMFSVLSKWIKSSWPLRDSDGYFIGPEAQKMELSGVPLLYVPTGVTIKKLDH
jgi:hypothetical protein